MKKTTPEEFVKLKLSDAILLAIKDLKQFVKSPNHRLDMSVYFKPDDNNEDEHTVCSACLAGVVLVTFDEIKNKSISEKKHYVSIYEIPTTDKKKAIDKIEDTFDSLRRSLAHAVHHWSTNISDCLKVKFQFTDKYLDTVKIGTWPNIHIIIPELKRASDYLKTIDL